MPDSAVLKVPESIKDDDFRPKKITFSSISRLILEILDTIKKENVA